MEEVSRSMEETSISTQGPQDQSAGPSQSQQTPPSQPEAMAAAGPQPPPRRTIEETVADLKTSPLFMTELDESNEQIQALQALAFEGTPLENGRNSKEQGNESFRERKYADARELYTRGIDILALQEAKRNRGEVSTHVDVDADTGAEVEVEDDDEEVRNQRAMLETLYVNRAACALELGNYRSCWTDCGFALRLNPGNVKALYRSGRALLAVGRMEEAEDVCQRGLELVRRSEVVGQTTGTGGVPTTTAATTARKNPALEKLERDIATAKKKRDAKQKAEEERLAKERRKKTALAVAIQTRGIRTRKTEKPPEMEDAAVKLVPDEEDPKNSRLVFPVVLLYPADLQSDFVKAFGEADTLTEHLDYVFPLPWDKNGEYTAENVECYVENVRGGLVKWGKRVPLLKVLASGEVEVVDDVLKCFVLPRGKAAEWVAEYKRQKAAGFKG